MSTQKKLDITKSEIYMKHPSAQGFLSSKHRYRNIRWVSLLIGCACVVLLSTTPKIEGSLGWILNLSIAAIMAVSMTVFERHIDDRPDPIMPDIWRLTIELQMSLETLCRSDLRTIEEVGVRKMVSLAVDVLGFESQVRGLKIRGASAFLSNLIHGCLDKHKDELKSRLSNIHRALRAFKLGPEKYDEAFKEAKKRYF